MSNQLTKNFKRSSFACHNGKPWPAEEEDALQALGGDLQTIRDVWRGTLANLYCMLGIDRDADKDAAIRVLSAYRPLGYNRGVGSNDTSQHTGRNPAKDTPPCAADIRPLLKGIPEVGIGRKTILKMFHRLILRLADEGTITEGGVGLYAGKDNMVHRDLRTLYGDQMGRWS